MKVYITITLQTHNFLICFLLILIYLPLPSHQNVSNIHHQNNLNDKKTNSDKISDINNVNRLANIAEELYLSQLTTRNSAAMKTRIKLAQLSSQWASIAQVLTLWKSNEVMEITKKAQAAQITSLKFESIATRLKSAVMAAQDVYNAAFDRYKTLSKLAKAAESHSTETSKALLMLEFIQSVREKWASDEQSRALRLSKHLQDILYDLKTATQYAQDAHEYALSARQYIHFHY